MKEWISSGTDRLDAVWLGGLFCPESLGPALIRDFAVAHQVSPDDSSLRVHCRLDLADEQLQKLAQRPGSIAIRGICIHGARWNAVLGSLEEPRANELNSELPTVLFEVRNDKAVDAATLQMYDCPLYRHISTPGSSNARYSDTRGNEGGGYVMTIPIPTSSAGKLHWQMRGVCAALAVAE
jgi:hypothetical protein